MCTKRKLEIKEVLLKNDKTMKWLSNKLHGVDVYYLLSDKCKTFDVSVYDDIISIFKKEGIIATPNEQCDKLVEQIFHLDAVFGHSLTMLNGNIHSFTKDNVLDFSEKKKLSDMLDKIENEFVNEINKSRRIIEA